MMYSYRYDTLIGELSITANDRAVLGIHFSGDIFGEVKETTLIREACHQLEEYFKGERETFALPLELNGSNFQKKVWKELIRIPYGETKSYKQIAEAVSNNRACRAVGMANNKNPIPIIIPCHRVIGASGKLVGYAGGLERKNWLLELEKSRGKRI
ncbi:MAG: methylated-DNA--[protein]-cysteine S-methyltransferase [Lachnospiraceae bacterium]